MKYQNFGALEKHLADTQHLSPVYLVSCSYEPDRKVLLDKIAQKFPKETEILRYPNASLEKQIVPITREMSLFGLTRLLIVEESEIEEEALLKFVQSPPPKTHLLLGILCGKEPKGLLEATKKGAVHFDLSKEKPWEREKRLIAALYERVLQAGKRVAPDLIERIIHLIGSDWQKLEREIEKLLAFVGSRHEILPSDLDAVVTDLKELSSWQMAEEIVWGQKNIPDLPLLDTSEFLALIGALRYQVQIGWQLASSPLESPPPQLKPYQVQKYGKLAHGKAAHFFEKALLKLYEMEMLAKSSGLQPRLLVTRFAAHLRT